MTSWEITSPTGSSGMLIKVKGGGTGDTPLVRLDAAGSYS